MDFNLVSIGKQIKLEGKFGIPQQGYSYDIALELHGWGIQGVQAIDLHLWARISFMLLEHQIWWNCKCYDFMQNLDEPWEA